jgi:hypothetical protein
MGDPDGVVDGGRRIDEDADHPIIGGWSTSAFSVTESGPPALERLACELARPPVPALRDALTVLTFIIADVGPVKLGGREGNTPAALLLAGGIAVW